MENWISVEDELPSAGGMYLVCKSAGGFDASCIVCMCKWRLRMHYGFEWGCEADMDRVTHWMPLPELPEGEKEK